MQNIKFKYNKFKFNMNVITYLRRKYYVNSYPFV